MESTTLTVSFDSDRAPVWGDFYAKNGTDTEGTDIYLYNSGFSIADPLVPAASGSEQNHLLVPDTVAVPAPGAVFLGSVGLSLAGYLLKRKEQVA